MKFLLNLIEDEKVETFGLDVGSASVKAVQLEQSSDGQYIAAKVGHENIEHFEADMGGENSKNIASAIESCLKSAGIGATHAVCAVRGGDVAVRSFEFPKMPLEEVSQAVLLEAEQVCPFDIKQSVVDYNLTDSADGQVKGLLVAATADAITNKSKLVRKTHLQPVMMDAESLALVNCFNHCFPQRPVTVGILNFGSEHVSLIIINENDPPFVRDLQCCGSDIVKWFVDSNGVDYKKAYSDLFGISDDVDDAQFSSDLNMACSNLANDISETLRYYSSNNGKQVEKIYICGGYACSQKLFDLLDRNLLANVQKWNPFDVIKIEPSVDAKITEMGPSFAVAAGLAMRKV